MQEAGASISNFHTRTRKTQVSDLPRTAETRPYTRKERNDTANQKDFTRAGQHRGQDKGTFRKYLPSPPPLTGTLGKTTSSVQKKKGKIANLTFFSGQLESSNL